MLYHPQFLFKIFFKCNFNKLIFLSHHQYILNMSEALYCILNMVWAWNKDSRHVNPITDRETDTQTVQAQKCTDTLGYETNSTLCLRNTALLEVCQTSLW